MLPPLPSTNWRIQSFLPTAQISFLIASASGVEKRRGLAARVGAELAEALAGAGVFASAALPFPFFSRATLRCCRKSRAEGVTTQFSAITTQVAPAATASCTSRIATTLRLEISMLFSALFTSTPQILYEKCLLPL